VIHLDAQDGRHEYLHYRLVVPGLTDRRRHHQAKKKVHGNLRRNLPEWVAGSVRQAWIEGAIEILRKAAQAGSISLKIPQGSSQAMETKDLYEFGPFRADGRRKSLTRNGEPIPVPAKAFDVLRALLQKPGQTVLKDELMKEVWPDTFVEEGNLTQMVSLLRKALGETDGGQSLIVTVPRQGYRFVGDLTDFATGEVSASASDQPEPAATNAGRRGLSLRAVARILAVKSGLKSIGWIGTVIAIVSGFSGWVVVRYRHREPLAESRLVRYTIAPQENTSYRAGRVSPDGRSLALVGVDTNNKAQLWVRRLDALATKPLAIAEFWPFWSPDSRFIAFAQDGKLKKIEASGGAPQTICNAPLVIGGSWNRDGTIIFSDGAMIFRVPAKGGEAEPLTRLDASRAETTLPFSCRTDITFSTPFTAGKRRTAASMWGRSIRRMPACACSTIFRTPNTRLHRRRTRATCYSSGMKS
jgi:DNA-binding winged helix-turn-helix (wHTH) protein